MNNADTAVFLVFNSDMHQLTNDSVVCFVIFFLIVIYYSSCQLPVKYQGFFSFRSACVFQYVNSKADQNRALSNLINDPQ